MEAGCIRHIRRYIGYITIRARIPLRINNQIGFVDSSICPINGYRIVVQRLSRSARKLIASSGILCLDIVIRGICFSARVVIRNILVRDSSRNDRSIISIGHGQLTGIVSILISIKSRTIGSGYIIEFQVNFCWVQIDLACIADSNRIIIQLTIREITDS